MVKKHSKTPEATAGVGEAYVSSEACVSTAPAVGVDRISESRSGDGREEDRDSESHATLRDQFGAPAGVELGYIAADLRSLAVRVDSLVLDSANVKDHGDEDLPTHAASLRQFGIRRPIVVQRSTRVIEAGNGCLLACRLNGWEFVPVIFEDDDHSRARAYALADNAVGTLAGWNETNLALAAADAAALFDDSLLQSLTLDLSEEVARIEAEAEAEQEVDEADLLKPEDIQLEYRVIAICLDQKTQIELLAELSNRGLDCKLSTLRVKE